jgi:hypothetical protein
MDAPRLTMLPPRMRKAMPSLSLSPALLIVQLCTCAKRGPTMPSAMQVPTTLPAPTTPTLAGLSRDIVTVPSRPHLLLSQSQSANGTMVRMPSLSTAGPKLMLGAMFPGRVFTRTERSTNAGHGHMVCGAR